MGQTGGMGGQYRPLAEAQVRAIHEASLECLREVGIEVESPEARDIYRRHGADVDESVQRVRFPRHLIEEAVARAPRTIRLCGRDPRHDLEVGGRRVYLGTGGAALRVLDLDTGAARRGELRDAFQIGRLVDALPHIHFYVRGPLPQDIPPEILDVNSFFACLRSTRKHVMASCTTLEGLKQVIEVGSLIAGGRDALRARPLFSFITCWSISPLFFVASTTELMLEVARQRVPVALSCAPVAGTTAPIALAGTLVQMNAEILAGLALVQLAAPGAPAMYGAVPAIADMRTAGYTCGAPEFTLMNAAAAQLAQFYGVPLYGSAGLSDSKLPDAQAGMEKAMSLVLVALAGANYIHHAAGIFESMTAVAYEQYVLDDDMLGMVLRILRGIEVSEESLSLATIRNVGPRGHYLGEAQTLARMRTEYFYPRALDRSTRDKWEAAGALDARERARRIARKILAEHRPAPLPPEAEREIRRRFDIRLAVE